MEQGMTLTWSYRSLNELSMQEEQVSFEVHVVLQIWTNHACV
jgi:hypothetical protein